jgi:replication factor A1
MASENQTPTEVEQMVSELVNEFSDQINLNAGEIEEKITTLADEYAMPYSEARRTVRNSLLDREDVDSDSLTQENNSEPSSNALTDAGDIDSVEEWIDVEVQVATLWDSSSDSVAQLGKVGDETGTVRFVSFAKSDLPELEQGGTYRLSSVVTDTYDGAQQIKLNSATEIERLDADIEAATTDEDTGSFVGAVVSVPVEKNGLVERCPKEGCGRVLDDGVCREHNEVDGEDDLRLKITLDSGTDTVTAYFDREETAEITGITLEDALEIAKENYDRGAVVDKMMPTVEGRYLEVSGYQWEDDRTGGTNIKVDTFDTEPQPSTIDPEQTLIKARSI